VISTIQVILVSATIPSDVLEVTKRFVRELVRILVKTEELSLEDIQQFYVLIEREEWKLDTLCDIYKTLTITRIVVFLNTSRSRLAYFPTARKRFYRIVIVR